MQAGVIAVAVIALVAIGGLAYMELGEHPAYTVEHMAEAGGIVTFTVIADLDESETVTLWADGTQLSVLGVDEWTAPAGHFEKTFIMELPERMSLHDFDKELEIHFDGKNGMRQEVKE